MRAEEYRNAEEFHRRVETFLCEAEAENCLIIGVLNALRKQWQEDARLFLVSDKDTIRMAATITPPRQLLVTRAEKPEQEALAHHLTGSGFEIPGVQGEADVAESFARIYAAAKNLPVTQGMAMRIFSLDKARPRPAAPGKIRIAVETDVPLLTEWRAGFARDAHLRDANPQHELQARNAVIEGRQFLWDDGGPVSMACLTGETPHGRRISGVYTPPQNRRRGYATSLVSALSQHLLDSGKRFCFLYTDLSNPTSNSIYAKIGYRPICDSTTYFFSEEKSRD